jgi:hypothetical protein
MPIVKRGSARTLAGTVALLVATGALALASCAESESYVYRPTEMATAATQGYATARYPVPPEAPRGEVYVTSFGVMQMDVAPQATASMLQIRMTVTNNNGDQPWLIDTRQQLADLGPEGRSRAAYVNTDVQGSPLISVAPGTQRVIDLYYSLPLGMQGAASLPAFDFLWRVEIPGRPVAERTPFARDRLQDGAGAPYPPYVASLGWGPYWWYDPLYPALTFFHPFILHQRYPFIGRPGYLGPRVGVGFRGFPVGGGAGRGVGLRGSPPHGHR